MASSIHYLNSRYYDPSTGRFISPDTISILDETKAQINGLNLYMYCGDNPIMRVDPSGMAWWEFWKWDWGAIGRAIVGATLAVVGAVITVLGIFYLFYLLLVALLLKLVPL